VPDRRAVEAETPVSTEERLARQVGFLIRKFYQKNQAVWQEMCVDPQMTSPQHAVLTMLNAKGTSSLTSIGRSAAMDHATTRGVVERLSARGMVSIERDTEDRRRLLVKLEEPGLKYLRDMEPVMPQIAEATIHPLNPAEQVALEFLLQKVTAAHRRKTKGGGEGA